MDQSELDAFEYKAKHQSVGRAISFEEAKRKYPMRYTKEHVPSWAVSTEYKPQYHTDAEWYVKTYFYGEHKYATKTNCYSTDLSWPEGQ